ncbi:hypothetical protein JYU34_005869 [Plutella xylostella]|uniref:Uncharacterized protein n=1 Tax=Plutella xylostella TaxID=51655 RepID=A0ABQ7QUC8_PLUXY|nr:hypothetical protein JYU34_005869 [Plutella xylostella]
MSNQSYSRIVIGRRQARAARAAGGAVFPARAAACFPRGARRPAPADSGNRPRAALASVPLGRRATTTLTRRALHSRTSARIERPPDPRRPRARGKNSELRPGVIAEPGAASMLLRPLLALALLLGAAARRHAPALREDEPARRTTRPAGKSHPAISVARPLHLMHRRRRARSAPLARTPGTCVYVNNNIPSSSSGLT